MKLLGDLVNISIPGPNFIISDLADDTSDLNLKLTSTKFL